jgi:hypothetical protein
MSYLRWIGASVAFVLALGFAAIALFSTIYLAATLGARPPLWGVIVLGAVVSAALVLGYRPAGSPWRVPASWQRLGHVQFAALFGFSLGLGVATSLSSVGFVVLVLLAATSSDLGHAAIIGVGFAIGRLAPFLWVVVRTNSRERHQDCLHVRVFRAEQLAEVVRPIEVSVLVSLMFWLLVTAR